MSRVCAVCGKRHNKKAYAALEKALAEPMLYTDAERLFHTRILNNKK